ncbi:HalOD1 output domain-containing protein [Halorientalis pallida]|uniref:Halobacterial output domain-containing protein n=1 Tax=Halorientalis pallida TaxID=2479928 RepID=A0A498KTW0_9EURY|nr:HalOD1 output domain-containing protein [Halorientalis pallida]RXK47755.1 hypothetical protein EAF64_13970 [Halorientalis pallida]
MGEFVTTQIIEAIAEVEGTEPEHLDIALERYVSTDAIRELATHDSDSWRLQFETQNHVVQVMGNNAIIVDGEQRGTFT